MNKNWMLDIKSAFIGAIIGGFVTLPINLYLLEKEMKDTHKHNVINEYFSLTHQGKLEYKLIRDSLDISEYKLQTFLEIEKSFGKLSMIIKDDDLLDEIQKRHTGLILSYSRFLNILEKSGAQEIQNASTKYHTKQEEFREFIEDKLF